MSVKAVKIFLWAMLMIFVGSCGKDESYQYGNFRYDMVTYAGSEDGRAKFNLIQRDDSELTLLTNAACSLDEEVGQRMLLNYVPDGAEIEGVQLITARSYTQAVTDSLRYTSDLSTVVMDSVRLRSVWRTGNYLNVSSEVKYTNEKRVVALVMDKSTWHSDTVHCYLVHNMLGEQAYFWRKCYASFYIGAVWKLPTCTTVRVHLNDVVYPQVRYYDFSKM